MVSLNFLLSMKRHLLNGSDEGECPMSFPTKLALLELLHDNNYTSVMTAVLKLCNFVCLIAIYSIEGDG